MKAVLRLTLIVCFVLAGCEKENIDLLVGKWKLVKICLSSGSDIIPEIQNQRMVKYTKDNIIIFFDYQGNEIFRGNYDATDSVITIYIGNNDGQEYSYELEYWFIQDMLKIRMEYYDECYARIK